MQDNTSQLFDDRQWTILDAEYLTIKRADVTGKEGAVGGRGGRWGGGFSR